MFIKSVAIIALTATAAMTQDKPQPKPQCAKLNLVCVQGSPFEQHLFQADALLRLGDAISTHKTVFDGSGRYHEMDPIAPGENHAVWMAYAFQAGAHVAVVQGHNLLIRHNHAKLARTLVIVDIIMEGYTVAQNSRLAAQ